MLLLLLGCIDTTLNTDDEVDVTIPEPGEMVLVLDPEVIDFGLVPLGIQRVEILTVTNAGEHDVFLTDYWFSEEGFGATMANNALEPGDSQEVRIDWTPDGSGEMSESVTLLAGTALSTQSEVPVGLSGLAEGPEVSVSLANHDFGTLLVGCSVGIPFTVSNVGNVDLSVSGVGLSYSEEFSVSGPAGGALPAFPWTLPPGEGQELTLSYIPETARTVSTTLRVSSNDPQAPYVDIIAGGGAVTEGENTDAFVVAGDQNITALIAVNEIAKFQDPYRDWFHEALPTFFEALQDLELDYRVAFVGMVDGEIGSEREYIDQELSAQEAAGVAEVMLELMIPEGDNDELFMTLDNTLANNASWLVDEEDVWADSKLSLVAINNNLDVSEGGFEGWVDGYRAYKDESEDVLIHAIGGPVPDGCEGAEDVEAEAMLGFNDAAAATGGLFFSVCEADWGAHLAAMAGAMAGERRTTVFELSQEPEPESIVVWVEEHEVEEGWSYNVTANAIVFDEEALPEAGALMEVSYELGVCND